MLPLFRSAVLHILKHVQLIEEAIGAEGGGPIAETTQLPQGKRMVDVSQAGPDDIPPGRTGGGKGAKSNAHNTAAGKSVCHLMNTTH